MAIKVIIFLTATLLVQLVHSQIGFATLGGGTDGMTYMIDS